MTIYNTDVLANLFLNYADRITGLGHYQSEYQHILGQKKADQLDSLLALYDPIYPLFEKYLWESDEFDALLAMYQDLFREQENLITLSTEDKRANFILSIPIADRPGHLKACLESIYQLCILYSYGKKSNGLFPKIMVIIVEDSKEQKCIDDDIELAKYYTQKGLVVHHYGLHEQYELMLQIPEIERDAVSSIIGEPSTEKFYHKGQAVTRNLSYLKAIRITEEHPFYNKDNTLYFFVDSDQLFQVNLATLDGDRAVYGLNYFYYINRIFSEHNLTMLTGKLVGDPPVSPSVMTVNFLDDVIAFMQQLANKKPDNACQFHPDVRIKPDDAAYHDMAQLFGFSGHNKKTYDYCCFIQGDHDHMTCLLTFAQRVNYFFFGEHLTRKTYFTYQDLMALVPARTIYPGNYITTFSGLKYAIPFGQLRLRMSGPTTGRLIQSEIEGGFASANLPMLHNRTLQTDFNDEFRPGVEADKSDVIDLGDEFERQFFGDLMLFSVAKLCQKNKTHVFDYEQLKQTFSEVENELLELYEKKHNTVNQRCDELAQLINEPTHWWQNNDAPSISTAIESLQRFIINVRHNFDKQSIVYQHIQSASYRHKKITQMIEVLLQYPEDRSAWDRVLNKF